MKQPTIYWINLARSQDRKQRMERRFAERQLSHRRVEAVDARQPLDAIVRWSSEPAGPPIPCWRAIDPIEAAVVASHLRAIKQAYDGGEEQALIFEDDVTFELFDQHPAPWQTLQHELPADFGMVQLCIAANPDDLAEHFGRTETLVAVENMQMASAAAYLISRPAMRCLLDAFWREDHFDLSARSAPAEHVLFGGPVYSSSAFSGPYTRRIPLFIYEGEDSLIASHHNDFLRPSRAFVLQHYPALLRGNFIAPFAPISELANAPRVPTQTYCSETTGAETNCAETTGAESVGAETAGADTTAAASVPQVEGVLAAPLAQRDFVLTTEALQTFLSGSRHKQIQRRRAPAQARANLGMWRKWLPLGSPPRVDGDVYCVPSWLLGEFASSCLTRQKRPFVLFTQSALSCAPSSMPGPRDAVLKHRQLRGWFSTWAYAEKDQRITPVPLGIDGMPTYHVYPPLIDSPLPLQAYALELQQYLDAVASWAPPSESRIPLAVTAEAATPQNSSPHGVAMLGFATERERWANASRCAVFLAPGNGDDSPSIWMALLFGFVVAAPRWPRHQELNGLPFVWFDDPRQVNEDFVRRAQRQHPVRGSLQVRRYLSFGYWHQRMLAALGGESSSSHRV